MIVVVITARPSYARVKTVLEGLKEDPATKDVLVVVVTATGEEGRARSLAGGADGYITKPFSPLALLRTVERALRGSSTSGS